MKLILIAAAAALLATPVAARTYSAIALSPANGAWGRATDASTIGEARELATHECRAHSPEPRDCRVVTWSEGGYCAAVATSRSGRNGAVGWGSASEPERDRAREHARHICEKESGRDCTTLADVCSHD